MKTLKKNPWYVAAGCFLQMFLGMGLCSSFSMMLPEISAHTGISTGSISGNLTVAYLASFIVSMFFFKPLLRKFGAKKLLIFGDFLLMFHYILYSYAESLWFLRICGTLGGLVTLFACATPVSVVITNWFVDKRSSVLDLLLPVIVLIALCIVGLIWTGGMWDTESDNYHNFVMSFSDATAGTGLCLGSIVAIVVTFIYYWLRGLISFNKSMESIPNGFIQMISPILILCFAWTLCGLCRDDGLQVGAFVEGVMANTGSLAKFLPAVIFIVACFIGFATGTSWGTIGIMVPLVCAVFDWNSQVTLLSIGLAASCAGGVCGDHLSPISDTTIMASAGAHCFHLNHVATQIPYGVTVAAVSFVSFIIAGLLQNVVICMIIAVVLMIATLLVIRVVVGKKHAGIFAEMAAADKALYNK